MKTTEKKVPIVYPTYTMKGDTKRLPELTVRSRKTYYDGQVPLRFVMSDFSFFDIYCDNIPPGCYVHMEGILPSGTCIDEVEFDILQESSNQTSCHITLKYKNNATKTFRLILEYERGVDKIVPNFVFELKEPSDEF